MNKIKETENLYKPETGKKENFVQALQFHQRIDSAAPASGLHEQDQRESRVAEIKVDLSQFRFTSRIVTVK